MRHIGLALLAAALLAAMGLEGKTVKTAGQEVALGPGRGRMYVSLPADSVNTGRAVVLCPGGRYGYKEMVSEGFAWMPYLNWLGYAAIVVDYTLPAGNPALPVGDVEEALRTVRRRAAEWGIKPGEVGIFGFSAGGHLASYVATNSRGDARPDFQCLFYPVVTMDSAYTHLPSRENLIGRGASPADVRRYSNELNVDSTSPRAFIVANANDVKVPPQNSINYYLALIGHGVPASLHVYPDGGHGWGLSKQITFRRQIMDELEAWLRSF